MLTQISIILFYYFTSGKIIIILFEATLYVNIFRIGGMECKRNILNLL